MPVTYNIWTDAEVIERQVFLWHNQTTHTVQKHTYHTFLLFSISLQQLQAKNYQQLWLMQWF